MRLAILFFFFVLNCKVNSKGYPKQCCADYQNIKSLHDYSSLSFGVKKYAIPVSIEKSNTYSIATIDDNFSANKEPIMPSIKTYLAESANTLATTFLLYLIMLIKYTTKRSQYEFINA